MVLRKFDEYRSQTLLVGPTSSEPVGPWIKSDFGLFWNSIPDLLAGPTSKEGFGRGLKFLPRFISAREAE
jgi:hypothetical protein